MARNRKIEARPDIEGPTVWEWLISLRPALPFTAEAKRLDDQGRCVPMSNGEIRRHLLNGAILINGERADPNEALDFPVFSLVFFPKGARRTTII